MRRSLALASLLLVAVPALPVPAVASPPAGRVASPRAARVACHRTLAHYPVLRPGARRPAVRTLQCVLNDDGYGPVAVDGWYGPQTRRAVRRVEGGFEGPPLHPGRVDSGYWVLLFGQHLPDRDLRIGDHGPAIRTLQRALRAAGGDLAVDGDFGPQTRRVVRAYQRSQQVPVTGVVDSNTRFFLAMGGVLGHSS